MTTLNKRRLSFTLDELNVLMDAMDSVHKPFTNWTQHDDIRRRLNDAAIWIMEAE